MSEYELEPTQHLRQLVEMRTVVAGINSESLELFIRFQSEPDRSYYSDCVALAAQITATELTLARLDREIGTLEAQIARGSEQQDPKPASDFRDEDWWARRGLQQPFHYRPQAPP